MPAGATVAAGTTNVIGGGSGALTSDGDWAGWLTLAAAAERAVPASRAGVALETGVGLAWLVCVGAAVGGGFVGVAGCVAAGEGGACDGAGVTVAAAACAAACEVGVAGTRVGVAVRAPGGVAARDVAA